MPTMTASPFGALTVIANPHAGEGRVGRELSALERGLTDRGLEYSLLVTDGPGDATRLATDALDAGARFLVAVGGDGTIQEVVNGMFRDGHPIVDEPVLGVVAAHSGCDLVKSFGLPGDVEAACGHLVGENTYPFDVLKVAFTGPDGARAIRYSVNLAEIGFGAAVIALGVLLPWLAAGGLVTAAVLAVVRLARRRTAGPAPVPPAPPQS